MDGNLGITRFELNGHYLYKTNAGGDYLVEKNDPGVLIAVAPRYRMGEQLIIPSSIHTIGWCPRGKPGQEYNDPLYSQINRRLCLHGHESGKHYDSRHRY